MNIPTEKYNLRAKKVNSLVCVGLDSDYDKLPPRFKSLENPQFEFNKWIIDQTADYAAAYKPNTAFYEARGEQGMKELKMTMDYLLKKHPDVFTICDAKRGDIGSTNNGYATSVFDWLGFDAITLHPYLGKEALGPFLDRPDKASVILCRTSNPGAGEIQDLEVNGKALWKIIAEKVSQDWDYNHNCMLVAGATYPDEIRAIRAIAPEMTLLVPGVGAQGGDVQAVLGAGLDSQKRGLIINSSRAIIFAEDPAGETKRLSYRINQFR